jgi:hypothetical protein
MIDAGLVGDQGIGDPAQVQEPVPLGRGPGQPGDLQGQDDTDLPERDLPVSSVNPARAASPDPLTPRSASMTRTAAGGQPSAPARLTRSYWRKVDSRLRSTWIKVDWRQ